MSTSKIGSIISIITKAESRYEGTLVEVDRVNKTMKLQNVHSMGTEGRRNGEKELPASDAITGSVKFRVDLIKSIKIVEEAKEEDDDEEEDPAIIESNEEAQEAKEGSQKKASQQQYKGTEEKAATGTQAAAEKTQKRQLEKYTMEGDEEGKDAADDDIADSRGAQRRTGMTQSKGGAAADSEKPKYDKSADFFDSISNSTLEVRPQRGSRGGGRGARGGYQGGHQDFTQKEHRGGWRGGDYRGGNRGGRPRDDGDSTFRGGWGRDNFAQNRPFTAGAERGGGYQRGGGRGGYRGNDYQKDYQGGSRGGRRNLYSDSLPDPNDPNYHKRNQKNDQGEEVKKSDDTNNGFFDNHKSSKPHRGGGYSSGGWNIEGQSQRRGGRGGFDQQRGGRGGDQRGRGRGGRGGGFGDRQHQNDKRDEDTFGEFSSRNFQFEHPQGGEKKRNADSRRRQRKKSKQEEKEGAGKLDAVKQEEPKDEKQE